MRDVVPAATAASHNLLVFVSLILSDVDRLFIQSVKGWQV